MGRRRLAREIVLQCLYLADVSRVDGETAFKIATLGPELPDEKTLAFARSILDGTLSQLEAIDERIRAHAQNWEIGRMAAVDRSILRMASFELINSPETPISVIIDEALEIAKKYSSEDSSRFINGILDKIKQYRRGNGGASPSA